MIITYPDKLTEFDIQSKICSFLINSWYDVKWEITVRNCSKIRWQKQCRFDLVIFKDKIAKIIIEVKNWSWKISKRQIIKYYKFWLPVFSFNENDSLDYILLKIKEILC
jgi:hypothetical protein